MHKNAKTLREEKKSLTTQRLEIYFHPMDMFNLFPVPIPAARTGNPSPSFHARNRKRMGGTILKEKKTDCTLIHSII
jgi:hypothetical protein